MRKIAYFASLFYIFTVPWEDAFTLGSFGSLTRLVGLFAALLWIVSVVWAGKFRKPGSFYLLVLLFIVWNAATFFWTVSISHTQQMVITYLQLMLISFILWDLYNTPEAERAGLQAFIFGAYVTIISALYNYATNNQTGQFSDGRYSGAGANAVDMTLTLALSLPIAWHLASGREKTGRSQLLRVLNYAYIPLALFAEVLTGSRTTIFVAIPAILYMLWTLTRLPLARRMLIFAGLIGAMLVLQNFIPQSVINRLSTTSSSISTGDLGGRVRLWRISLRIAEQSPILGIGSGALDSPAELGAVAHNTFLSVMTETGVIGLGLYLLLLAFVVIQALRQPKAYAFLWITILIIWALGVFTLTWEVRKTTWVILTQVIISAGVHHRLPASGVVEEPDADALPAGRLASPGDASLTVIKG